MSKYQGPRGDYGPYLGRSMFPTRTRGNGRVRNNHLNDGSGQGQAGSKKVGHCYQCGYLNDFRIIDSSGGVYSGNGGRGGITLTNNDTTDSWGTTLSSDYGDASISRAAGCALCGSKNAVGRR